jgi:hypothetical protein
MNRDTADLNRALDATNQHLPRMVNDVLLGQMPPKKQHEFAELLIELGELLHRNADADAEQAKPAVSSGDTTARDTPPPGTVPQITNSEEELL